MSAYNWIQENCILPVNDILSGRTISRALRFLLESQFWSFEMHQQFQEERLRLLVRHAYDNVPFYHDLFKSGNLLPSDIRTINDLHKMPVILKDDLRNHPVEYYLARNIPKRKYVRMNSSGSTGEPFTYFMTQESFSMNYACAIRGWYWMGYRLGDTYTKMSQNRRSGFIKRCQDLVLRNNYMFIRDLTPDNLHDVIQGLNDSQPEFIRCYPDPLVFMAELINNGKMLKYSPKAINTTGNILTKEARAKIENAFKAPVFDSYSCEASAQFFEDPARKAYLASMEYAITEVLDNQQNAVNTGRHITTDLWNFAMPFIRYDTQDIIEKSEMLPGSDRQLTAFSQITGRNSDILVTPSGKYLIVHTFTIFFEYFEEIKKFQVIQNSADSMKVRLAVNNRYSLETEKSIFKGLRDLIGEDVKIEMEIVTDIPLLASGKRKFLIRDETVQINL